MSGTFIKPVGGERFEIKPIAPYSDAEISKLIDDGSTINEHLPEQVIRRKDIDEAIAEFKIVPDDV